jgi:hypothetical protein
VVEEEGGGGTETVGRRKVSGEEDREEVGGVRRKERDRTVDAVAAELEVLEAAGLEYFEVLVCEARRSEKREEERRRYRGRMSVV